MATQFVGDFDPKRRGFHFSNTFPSEPLLTIPIPGRGSVPIGDAANGLCGGMAFAVRDLYEARRLPPADATPPPEGSPLFDYLVRRLIDSFDLPDGPLRYYRWMTLPDEDSWIGPGIAARTRREWARVQRALDRDELCPLGLVRTRSLDLKDLGKNHQVLAFGYELDEASRALTLHVYDPNHPDQAVRMSLGLGAGDVALGLSYQTGEATRGFFLSTYAKRDPGVLVGPSAIGSDKS